MMQDVDENNGVALRLYNQTQSLRTKLKKAEEGNPNHPDALMSLFREHKRLLLQELDEIRVDRKLAGEEDRMRSPTAQKPVVGRSHFSNKSA